MKRALAAALAALALSGCLSHASYPLDPAQLRRGPEFTAGQTRPTTQEWIVAERSRLADLWPDPARPPLTADEIAAGRPDPGGLYAHFGLSEEDLGGLFSNWSGTVASARVCGTVRTEPSLEPKPAIDWPGFSVVEIPHCEGFSLPAKYAAQPAQRAVAGEGDAIIIVHGLFGSLNEYNCRDLAVGLNRLGFTVLALEMRGHGAAEVDRPHVPIGFGLTEPDDILAAAGLLREMYGAKRIGAVGFSMGALHCLLATVKEGETPRVGPRLLNGGVVAVSPPLDVQATFNRLSSDVGMFENPSVWTMQTYIEKRLELYELSDRNSRPVVGRSLENLLWYELERGRVHRMGDSRESTRSRVLPALDFRSDTGRIKLEKVRTPVLLLHAADDPVVAAGPAAELAARVRNENVGFLITPTGGHMGFPAVSKAYYYNLVVGFFDPARGPEAKPPRAW